MNRSYMVLGFVLACWKACTAQLTGNLDIQFNYPIQFVLTDAEGRRCGMDPRDSGDYDEIPDMTYGMSGIGSFDESGPNLEFTELSLKSWNDDPDFSEHYTLQVIGTDNRSYQGEIALAQTMTVGVDLKVIGVIGTNQSITYNIFFSTNVAHVPTMKKIVTSNVLRQDLINCRMLRFIPDSTLYQNLLAHSNQYDEDMNNHNCSYAWNDLQKFMNRLDDVRSDTTRISRNASTILYEDATILQRRQYQLTVSVSPTGGGTTSLSGQTCQDSGSVVSVTATAAPGYNFLNWSGDANGERNALSVVMNRGKTITATFTVDGH
jgi:hypothetical protein